ncbi:MAG: hypothetical protein DI529_02495 [Chryseobacterium sp.]|nr:MAG: hypothetical protein DI529_02495 [Chryseobacterium sp.]
MLQIRLLLKNRKRAIVFLVFLLALICVYYFFDPVKYPFFLKCPLKTIMGYDCAGCGVQRSFHSLLHFRFLEAFKFNPLFVLSIPTAIFWVLLNCFKSNYEKNNFFKLFFRKSFFIVLIMIILLFSLFRNTEMYQCFLETL